MSAEILDGKGVAKAITDKIREDVRLCNNKPGLAIIIVGDDYASKIYAKKKEETCKDLGIYSEKYELPDSIDEEQLVKLIEKLNDDKKIHGILVQLPLPPHINENKIIETIDPTKDVDGFNQKNVGNLFMGNETIVPCTPKGVIRMLEMYEIKIAGKHVVVVGRSNIVGRPVSALFLNRDATVTVCHSKTQNLSDITKTADILLSATGNAKFITGGMVKKGVAIIDIGIARQGKKIVGDVDFESVKEVASYITPVPGGVGPVTVAILMENLMICHKFLNKGATE